MVSHGSLASTEPSEKRGLSGLWHRLTRTQAEAEAAELLEQLVIAADPDITRIVNCDPGDTVHVRGMIRAITIKPRSTLPALEVDLYDGTGTMTVIWMGRRRIPGIDPGRTITVHGRLTGSTDHLTMYNPKYELKPAVG